MEEIHLYLIINTIYIKIFCYMYGENRFISYICNWKAHFQMLGVIMK